MAKARVVEDLEEVLLRAAERSVCHVYCVESFSRNNRGHTSSQRGYNNSLARMSRHSNVHGGAGGPTSSTGMLPCMSRSWTRRGSQAAEIRVQRSEKRSPRSGPRIHTETEMRRSVGQSTFARTVSVLAKRPSHQLKRRSVFSASR